jgi:hypothetical protein
MIRDAIHLHTMSNMYVYHYIVTYTLPDSDAKKSLRVIAADLKSLIATVEASVPGAVVIGAPAGTPVDAIAVNVVSAEVQVSPVLTAAQQVQRPMMLPAGAMPMMAGNAMMMGGPQAE